MFSTMIIFFLDIILEKAGVVFYSRPTQLYTYSSDVFKWKVEHQLQQSVPVGLLLEAALTSLSQP